MKRSWSPPGDSYTEPVDPDLERAARLVEIASLNRREAAALARVEADGVDRHDPENAEHQAWLLGGSRLAAQYVSLLESVTQEICATERFARRVAALIPALIEHRRLSGRAVREISPESRRRRFVMPNRWKARTIGDTR
jgi:hypothetical protein